MGMTGEIYRQCLPERADVSSSQELHVLAVDDSHVDRKFIERLLKISSCKVTAVESGTRALQFLGLDEEKKSSVGFDSLKVNLIMTDYSMPGMTGYELLKKIKESSVCREIPVVIMSSENVLARIDRCLEEGAEEFIVKPVKLSDVKRLKDCIMNGAGEQIRGRGNHKRKLQDAYDHPSSSPSPSISFPISSSSDDHSASSSPSSSTPLSSSPSLASDISPEIQSSSSPSSSPHCSSKRPRLRNTD